jgi:endonuclease/exonuclease/phosphatase (EEP) superfamily protein YafD
MEPSIMKQPSRTQRIAGLAPWLMAPVAIALLLPWFNRLLPPSPSALGWMLDLAAHWQILYAPIWLALCLIAAVRAKRWLLLAPFALLPLWSASASLPTANGNAPALTVAVANVHVSNRDPAPLVAWLRAHPTDVVILNELTPIYADAIAAAIGDMYPHREFAPEDSPFGIGLMARSPLTAVDLQRSGDGIPALGARIDLDGKPVRIVAVHPVPPLAIHWQDERDRLLRNLARDADRAPLVVAGDLNASPWSTALTTAAMSSSSGYGLRRATGLSATWSHSSFVIPLGIPIDHVLASRHWHRGTSERGPDIGSDHRPVRAELYWADDQAVSSRPR